MPSLSLYFLINERQLSSWSFGFNQHQQWNIYLPKKNTFHAPFDHVAHMHRHQLPKARSEAAERFASTARSVTLRVLVQLKLLVPGTDLLF